MEDDKFTLREIWNIWQVISDECVSREMVVYKYENNPGIVPGFSLFAARLQHTTRS